MEKERDAALTACKDAESAVAAVRLEADAAVAAAGRAADDLGRELDYHRTAAADAALALDALQQQLSTAQAVWRAGCGTYCQAVVDAAAERDAAVSAKATAEDKLAAAVAASAAATAAAKQECTMLANELRRVETLNAALRAENGAQASELAAATAALEQVPT